MKPGKCVARRGPREIVIDHRVVEIFWNEEYRVIKYLVIRKLPADIIIRSFLHNF